nr:PREDICTED: uncharacterized protein LOC108225517 isoform X3 [Daucus carota subsp. sativus]
MIQGYKPKSVRKRKKFAEKENVKGNSAKRFSFPTSSVTDGRHDTPPPRIPSAVTGTPLTLRQTQYSSAHGGTIPCDFKHSLETAGFLSTPENTLNTKRTPLSNITNIVDDNNVPITRKYLGHQNSAVISSTPENTLNTTRTPLSNITNIVDINSKRNRCKYLGMYENNLRDTARNLFAETSSRLDEYSAESSSQTEDTAKCMPDDDNASLLLECSTVQDPVLSDDSDNGYISGSSSIDEDYVPGMDTDCDSDSEHVPNLASKKTVPKEYVSLGSPESICSKCNARLWKEERVNKQVTKGLPIFSICCRKGDVKLAPAPRTPSYLLQLYNNKETGPHFQRSIRLYNAMFAFTSTGGNVDHSINNGRGPYVYRLNGQNHHVFGQLIPDDGQAPKYCQLYIYDTANEVNNRLRWVNVEDQKTVEKDVVQGLIQMLDQTNELVSKFRMARDRFENHDFVDLKVELKVCRSQSGRENHISTSDEVAGIMVGTTDNTTPDRDIIVEKKFGGLQRISYIHPKLMALQYPLLFPDGEDGYHNRIPFQSAEKGSQKEKDMISMKDYYSYRFQVRDNEGMTPRLGGRLFQQYMVDAFSTMEQTRLWWFRTHQTILRNELYTHISDSVRKGDANATNVGKGIILPAGYVGSKRYMQQNFQDALAVCRHVGHPDVFLTMTCNSMWDEIQRMMTFVPGCIPSNNPDIISRVFHLKLDQLTNDINKKGHFGKCIGVMYVVEFQKRGLPHVHMLIWLDAPSKKYLKENVDKFVSAEIPDPLLDPVGYAAVKAYMMHGPCGLQNPKSPCMKNFKCIRHFPKKYSSQTVFDDSGFPLYRRRKSNITVNVHKADLDNRWVVPYNRDLLVKYQCHMNIEICCHARSIKYLFKYCLKGHDTATVEITGRRKKKSTDETEQPVDEIQAYFDGRYVCGAEAAYRIFGFPIHHRTLSVERLPFHLPGQKNCTFRASEKLEKVLERENERLSKLEAFFMLNKFDINARRYTYDQIPQHYVWNDLARRWTTRKRGAQIGRLSYTHHSSGEVWYLRMLLTKVRGPT